MRRTAVLVTLVSLLAGAYVAGKVITTPVAHAQEGGVQPWYASVDFINALMQRLDHLISNDDRKTTATETMAAEAVKQTKEMEKQTEQVGKLAAAWQKLADMCGCQLPWTLPRTGGGGSHHHNPTEATATPTKTPDPQCSGTVYRWCEDGNILVTICDGKRLEDVHCAVCHEANEEGKAYCAAPTATSTSTPGPTPIPPTGTPPPLVKTPNPGCPEAPHWVCDGAGNWLWKACGVTLCTTTCTLGCSSVPGVCKTMVLTPDPLATKTPTTSPYPGPASTPTKTAVPVYPTATPIEICDGGTPGHLVPCPPTATKTSGPGPSATRTPTSQASATLTPHGDPVWTNTPAATLPIATKIPTQVVIPTATWTAIVTNPSPTPVFTPSALRCKTDREVTADVQADGTMTVRPIGTEFCLFDWNGHGNATALAHCPAEYICTFDTNQVNGADIEPGVRLVDGDGLSGSWTFRINRASFRWKPGYPKDDDVWNRCALLIKERAFAFDRRHAVGFEVWPFGFDCTDAVLITTKSGRVCPAFGMTSAQTYPLLTEWDSSKCKLPWQPFKRSGNVPVDWLLEAWDGTAVVKLGPSSYWEGFVATFWPR